MSPEKFTTNSNVALLGKKYPKAVEKACGKNKVLQSNLTDPAYFVFVLKTDNDEIPMWAKEKLDVLKVVEWNYFQLK